jgi:hypothetical protein
MSNNKLPTTDVVNDEDVDVSHEVEGIATEAVKVTKSPEPQAFSAFKEQTKKDDGRPPTPMNLFRGDIEGLIAKYYPDDKDELSLISAALLASSLSTYSERSDAAGGKLDKFIHNVDNTIKTAVSQFHPKVQHGEVTTADAVAALLIAAGVNDTWQMPLVNSGFRISLNTPSAEDRILLDEKLVIRMGELGRYTYGASFSNTSAYMDTDIFNFFLDHVAGHNIEGVALKDKGALRKYIKAEDFDAIITLMVHAINRDGYDVVVPCPGKECNHITNGLVTPSHLIKYDQSLLTDLQRDIITRPMSKQVSIKDLVAYQDAFTPPKAVSVTHNGVTYEIYITRPSLHDRCRVGTVWCDGINNAVDKFLHRMGGEDNQQTKRALVERLLDINALTSFLPYFQSVRIYKQDPESAEYIIDNTVTGIEAINLTVKSLINVPDLLTKVLSTIDNLANEINPVGIGVPRFKCSKCDHMGDSEFVPVSIKTQFFTHALGQKALLTYLQAN